MAGHAFQNAVDQLKLLLPKRFGFGRKRTKALIDALDTLSTELALLSDENARLRAELDAKRKKSRDLDAFYLTFENRYRGTEDSIRNKLRPYLADLEFLAERRESAAILDIGCGRGEWLTLLREAGFACASGVDSNRRMVDTCVAKGLDLICADVFEFLRSTPANTYDAISGFHIIEHFDFERLIELLELTFTALKPGGITIFETPNPRNLIVGGNTFYFDPTHVRPVPSELLGCVAEHFGYRVAQIYQRNPYPDLISAANALPADAMLLRNALACGLDYGIILRKPTA